MASEIKSDCIHLRIWINNEKYNFGRRNSVFEFVDDDNAANDRPIGINIYRLCSSDCGKNPLYTWNWAFWEKWKESLFCLSFRLWHLIFTVIHNLYSDARIHIVFRVLTIACSKIRPVVRVVVKLFVWTIKLSVEFRLCKQFRLFLCYFFFGPKM